MKQEKEHLHCCLSGAGGFVQRNNEAEIDAK
jgi:hypothetical protein